MNEEAKFHLVKKTNLQRLPGEDRQVWSLGGVVRMDDRERSILRRSRSLFIRDLADVVTVCDRLYQREVLSEGMKNEILVSIWMIQSYIRIITCI